MFNEVEVFSDPVLEEESWVRRGVRAHVFNADAFA